MNNECSIVKDLLPLYVENMTSEETTNFINNHLNTCAVCKSELDDMSSDFPITKTESKCNIETAQANSFKTIMRKMNRQFNSLAYALVILFIFLGFSWTGGENLMYNSLIMPIVGVFGYVIFRWKSLYAVPLLLLITNAISFVLNVFRGIEELGMYSRVMWTGIYSVFVIVGIMIAGLIHYAFRKE